LLDNDPPEGEDEFLTFIDIGQGVAHDPLYLSTLQKKTEGPRKCGRSDDFLPQVPSIASHSPAYSTPRFELAAIGRHFPDAPARYRAGAGRIFTRKGSS